MSQDLPLLKRFRSIVFLIFWPGLWVCGLGTFLLYPVRWLSGDLFDLIRLSTYITPWFLLFLVPAMVVAGSARRPRLLAILAIPTLLIGFTFAPLFLPRRVAAPPANALPLKVMSYNLHAIQDTQGIARIIRQEQPDLLLVQELHPGLVSLSLDALADLYPELYVEVVSQPEVRFVQAVVSRYPLKEVSAEFEKGRVQKVKVETPAGEIAVWNVHFLPPFLVPPTRHDQQAIALAADIATVETPLIVAGDFNATELSTTYKLINRHLRNAHWEVGGGFGFSFPAPPYTLYDLPLNIGPLYRIDHIFYSQHFRASAAQTVPNGGGSDHFPVVAQLWLVKEGS
jgi:vancomycin resistance protein VanJ